MDGLDALDKETACEERGGPETGSWLQAARSGGSDGSNSSGDCGGSVGSNASGSGATMQECERNGEAARKAW